MIVTVEDIYVLFLRQCDVNLHSFFIFVTLFLKDFCINIASEYTSAYFPTYFLLDFANVKYMDRITYGWSWLAKSWSNV